MVFGFDAPAARQAMTARSINKQDWEAFCDGVSFALEGSNAEIEVESLDLGSQIERESTISSPSRASWSRIWTIWK
jgi:hypothetical protein